MVVAPTSGFVDPAFDLVAEAFHAGLADGRQTGAAVAAYVDGRLVVTCVGAGWMPPVPPGRSISTST